MRRPWRRCSGVLLLALCAAAPARRDVLTLGIAPLPPMGFTVLPYANADAPKGGTMTVSAVGSFDNLNPFILSGTAPDSIYRVWQPLFKLSDTDSVTAYAELARAVTVQGDAVTFYLDPRARFSDGSRVTAADVMWTFNTLVSQGSPFFAGYYAGVAGVAAPDDGTVVFTMKPGAGRDLPLDLATMYVLPAHFWRGRNFGDPLLVAPVGSGPYQVSRVAFGASITYARVKDWWAADLPSDRGFYNFDRYSEQFFGSDAVALQAFKAGQIDARDETEPQRWPDPLATMGDQRVRLAAVPLTLPAGIRGLGFNTRHAVFADPLVREALTLAFDFGWMNRVLFHGTYVRERSFFNNSFYAATGLPSAAELALLAPYRASLPAAVFDAAYQPPQSDGSGYDAAAMRAALVLLGEAGWRVKDFKLEDAAGRRMAFEILLDQPAMARFVIPYAADLKKLGIVATVRVIDVASYQRRMRDFDFDMTDVSVPATDFPGAEQADYWGCRAARLPGSDNLTGICGAATDAMIAAELAAPDAPAKATAIHALDRLLVNDWVIIPFWTAPTMRLTWWADRVVKQDAALQTGRDYDLWWAK